MASIPPMVPPASQQTATTIAAKELQHQRRWVHTKCRELVKVSEFDRTNPVICLDGTSCTKKTTILSHTGLPVYKTTHNTAIQNPDSLGTSMMGYLTASWYDQQTHGVHLRDRSPQSCLEWAVLWASMNQRVTQDEPPEGHEHRMRLLKNSHLYRFAAQRSNVLALVDSNVPRCDALRQKRNLTESDRERSRWSFYTEMQNTMYRILHEGRVIDLAEFDACSDDAVVAGIADFIVELQRTLTETAPGPGGGSDSESFRYRTPTLVGKDLTTRNLTTFAHRALIRQWVNSADQDPTPVDRSALPSGICVSRQVINRTPLGDTDKRSARIGSLMDPARRKRNASPNEPMQSQPPKRNHVV